MYKLSDILYLTMNMLVKSAEVECRGPLMRNEVRQPLIRAYMNDLTVTTSTIPGCRWVLQGLNKIMTLARMKFKLTKLRPLVLKRGDCDRKVLFQGCRYHYPVVKRKTR